MVRMATISSSPSFVIVGYSGCGYYHNAVKNAKMENIIKVELPTRKEFITFINRPNVKKTIGEHTTSPVVWEMPTTISTSTKDNDIENMNYEGFNFIGGSDQFLYHIGATIPSVEEDNSSMSSEEIFAYFKKKQAQHNFVIWTFIRGLW